MRATNADAAKPCGGPDEAGAFNPADERQLTVLQKLWPAHRKWHFRAKTRELSNGLSLPLATSGVEAR